MHDFTKSERRKIRELAGVAWDRELRAALIPIGEAIQRMEASELSPGDVDQMIHKFHDGTSRQLYRSYTDGLPWIGVGEAYARGVLTDDDLAGASDHVREKLQGFAQLTRELNETDD